VAIRGAQGTLGSASLARASSSKTLIQRIWAARWCYLFMLPALILTTMFTLYPSVASWYYSLLDWSGFTNERTFVGLSNYAQVIHDQFFWNAFGHSFLFVFGNLPIRLTLALIAAIVLNDRALRLAPLFRTLLFIPVVTTEAIVGIVMTFVLSPAGGPVNQALLDVHLITQPIDFLGNPHTALWTVVAVSIWKGFGIPMIYWLAALQTIPQDVYEAARVDGAGWWQTFRFVTAPLLVPFGVVIVLITAVNTLNVFALVQSMTAGGPFYASEVMDVFIYRLAFGAEGSGAIPQLGYASAAAVFFGLTVMMFTVLQAWSARKAHSLRLELTTKGGR
jgi:ABC-type sugar transport system permease subunit